MIYSRLILAKNLLHAQGVLFISIDDNEMFNLVKLCEEIFGISTIKVLAVKMSEASGLKMASVKKLGTIPKLKEYVLVIKPSGVNDLSFTPIKKSKWDAEYNIYLDNFTEEDKSFYDSIKDSDEEITNIQLERLDAILQKVSLKSISDVYEGTSSKKEEWLFENSWRICQCVKSPSIYKLSEEKKKTHSGKDVFSVKSTQGLVYLVRTTYSPTSKNPRIQLIFASDNLYIHPGDFWAHIKTTGLDNEGGVPYKNGKKPLKLISELIGSLSNLQDGDIILDFFAGSATTGEATMLVNKEKELDLRYILVQLPEDLQKSYDKATGESKKQIKESIDFLNKLDLPLKLTELGKERLRKCGIKHNNSGFKVLKLDKTNIQPWDANIENLEEILRQSIESIKSDRSNEDVLYEILLKYGIELTVPVETEVINGKQVFVVGAGALIVCLDDGITSEVVEGIAKLKDELDPETTQVVFKDAGFADCNVKTNAIQILKQAGIDDVKSI